MKDQEDYKTKMGESVKGLEGAFEGLKQFENILKSQLDLAVPLDKKDVVIDGLPVYISLTKDNNVVVSFPSMAHAKAFYDRDNFNTSKKTFWQKIFGK